MQLICLVTGAERAARTDAARAEQRSRRPPAHVRRKADKPPTVVVMVSACGATPKADEPETRPRPASLSTLSV
jgi:hypothetical protein